MKQPFTVASLLRTTLISLTFFLFLALSFLAPQSLFAQEQSLAAAAPHHLPSSLSATGRIIDSSTHTPIAGATVELGPFGSVQTDEEGYFVFRHTKPGSFLLKVTSIGYNTYETTLSIAPGASPADITLSRVHVFMQPVEIRALRAGDRAPFTKTNLNKSQIEATNLGQDLPFLLNQTPAVTINSDAGNGVGYTGIHIRGTDASRINMTLNGIPYNDAESQQIYFVDLPDFASSVNSIQIQRGVGTSSNGAGAFGATINFSTNEYNDKPYAEFNNSFGSFDTWKNTVKVGSGLIDGHFTIDARLSRISSDGYIDRATSALHSFYLSAAWMNQHSSLRLNLISGTEKTYQAWNGIPEAKLFGDQAALDQHYQDNLGYLYFSRADSLNLYNSNRRTYNYFTYDNQTDNYQQDHYQLFFNHQFSEQVSFNTAAFLTRGRGYYEEYVEQAPYADYGLIGPIVAGDTTQTTDLVRQQWLDNYFYGGIFSLQYKQGPTQLTLGGGWDKYDGKHYAYVIWTANGGIPKDYRYYNLPAHKTDFNVYGKWQQQLTHHLSLFTDLQLRTVGYDLEGFQEIPTLFINKHYTFVNPKAGLTWALHEGQAYLSWSHASHEPNRDDFEAGLDQLPQPETLDDFELGYEKKNNRYSWGATAYYMKYKDQLALTGKINDVGEYTRTNIPHSYRLGLELEGSARFTTFLGATANLALSQNKISNYTEYMDDYDNGGQKSFFYKHPDIAFSPDLIGAATLQFFPLTDLQIALPAKYVSKQYMDNTQRDDRSLRSYYTQDVRISYTLHPKPFKAIDVIFQLNNVFNKQYEPNGYTYSSYSGGSIVTENFYFPMAGTNFMAAVNIKL